MRSAGGDRGENEGQWKKQSEQEHKLFLQTNF